MQIALHDPVQQTIFFGIVFGIIVLSSLYKKKNYTSLSLTQELKGFAILAIVFAHIGYALSNDSRFLFPFSIFAGVGVNLFLFLSGYGITYSKLHKEESIASYYKRRLLRLFIPFWIVLAILFFLDYVVTGGIYTKTYVLQSVFGFFTSANLYTDINAPLWYFSLILFYYLLFPLVFLKRAPWITAIMMYLAVWLMVHNTPPFLSGVIGLYQVHISAFPLGIFTAWYIHKHTTTVVLCKKLYAHYEHFLYPTLLLLLSIVLGYLALHANIGKTAYLEEATSLCTMVAIMLFFILKKRESRVCMLFGFYSYEIYLFHWPLLYHYDILYKYTPAWLATLLYLGVFIGIAFVLRKLTTWVFQGRTA